MKDHEKYENLVTYIKTAKRTNDASLAHAVATGDEDPQHDLIVRHHLLVSIMDMVKKLK